MKTNVMMFAAALALAGCGESKVETETPAKGVDISIDVKDDATAMASAVNIEGDSETGKFEIKLPGGLEAKVKVPDGMTDGAKFDIDGVGLYPGAKVGSVKVNAQDRKTTKRAVVEIGFAAPADAAVVADWYQGQFEAKKIAISRTGETISGKTEDGDDFTLALKQAAPGNAKGVLTIIDIG
ncbi:MAG: hypothetical protein ACOYLS_08770 [Polymorphobacter sp.]